MSAAFDMKTLSLEFSSDRRSVAVCSESRVLGQASAMGLQGRDSFQLVRESLESAGVNRDQIHRLVVGLGPGSYVGTRMAVAIAIGWRTVRAVAICGFRSTDAMAAQAGKDGRHGIVTIAVDARKDEVCLARYRLGSGQWELLEPLKLQPRSELLRREKAGDCLLGPNIFPELTQFQQIFPEAARLGEIAVQYPERCIEPMAPIYLRPLNLVKAAPPRFTA